VSTGAAAEGLAIPPRRTVATFQTTNDLARRRWSGCMGVFGLVAFGSATFLCT